jgi:peptidoglycan hydrolase CwlO-like protein
MGIMNMRRGLSLTIAVVFGLSASEAFADKLSDFEEAVKVVESKPRGKAGCKSIPYSDYRSSCESDGSKVHEWCDGGSRGPVTCGSESITRQVKLNVEKETKFLEELKEKKNNLERDQSRASTDDEKNKIGKEIEQTKKDIEEAEKRLEQAKKELEMRKRHVDDAIYTLDQCIAYRRAVMNSFAAALDKVRSEDETPKIKELAIKLRNSYEEGKSGHEIEITGKENALRTCRDSRL